MVQLPRLGFALTMLLFCGGIVAPAFGAEPSLSANQIVDKAVEHAQKPRDNSGMPGYTYTKVTVTEEFDATGNVKERKEKIYQVFFEAGSTRLKLVEVNGRSPDEADLKKQAENEKHVQKMTGQPKSPASNRENPLTPELVARFDFKLQGMKDLNGRRAYQIAFQPKTPEPPVRHIIDRLLNRISGTVFIDAEEFEIARADILLGSEVNLLGGVVGSLKKLAFTMTRTRFADGIWFNTFSSGDFEGRKLLDSTRIKTKSQSTNFRPLRLAS